MKTLQEKLKEAMVAPMPEISQRFWDMFDDELVRNARKECGGGRILVIIPPCDELTRWECEYGVDPGHMTPQYSKPFKFIYSNGFIKWFEEQVNQHLCNSNVAARPVHVTESPYDCGKYMEMRISVCVELNVPDQSAPTWFRKDGAQTSFM